MRGLKGTIMHAAIFCGYLVEIPIKPDIGACTKELVMVYGGIL